MTATRPLSMPRQGVIPDNEPWEISNQGGFGFIVRAPGDGGLGLEDDKPEALAALEKGLRKWFEEQG